MALNVKNNSTFLQNVLSNPDFHIPVEANFIVSFSNLNGTIGTPGILDNLSYNYNGGANGSLNTILDKINIDNQYWTTLTNDDIFFANGVTLPGESVKASRAGYSHADTSSLAGGFLSAPVLNGRSDTTNFEITFLETNVSFVDYVIRPWIIAASHFGLFARNGGTQNFKSDVTINFLNKTSPEADLDLRKVFQFRGAVPLSVEAANIGYGSTKNTGMRSIRTTWTYSTYEVI